MKERAGVYLPQPAGYKAYIPKPLPPQPPVRYADLQRLISEADRALAKLDGITTVLPNPEFFLSMYVRKEALLSSQIEGTQASLEGVLEYEADMMTKEDINDLREVVNYIKALDHGIMRLAEMPMSLRLIKEIHKILMDGVRGKNKTPGEFKRSQNWVGPHGATLNQAVFVPPPPEESHKAMSDLEKYLHTENGLPPLVKIALIHAQFETIHPFLDGNGRVGRLLITYYLFWKGILSKPLLYLSLYLKRNQQEYYSLLMKIRTEGDWESWVKFFLTGIAETSDEAAKTAKAIIMLKEKIIATLCQKSYASSGAIRMIDVIFNAPIIDANECAKRLKISQVSANQLLHRFEEIGVLKEITGKKRYKKYLFKEFVSLMAKGTEQ